MSDVLHHVSRALLGDSGLGGIPTYAWIIIAFIAGFFVGNILSLAIVWCRDRHRDRQFKALAAAHRQSRAKSAAAPSARESWPHLMPGKAAGATTVSATTGAVSVADVKVQEAASTATAQIEDSYEMDELDDDWKPIMQEIDRRIQAKGHTPLNGRERAVAIKQLLSATGSRGVTYAMEDTIKEVLAFRKVCEGRNPTGPAAV